MRMKSTEIVGTVAIVVLILIVIAMVFVPSMREAPKRQCLTNLKDLAIAISTYAEDSGSYYPQKDNWADVLAAPTITENKRIFVCPEAHPSEEEFINIRIGEKIGLPIGYSFFAPLSGEYAFRIQEPEKTPIFFDSNHYALNSSTDLTSLAFRHSKKTANILFADGRVESVSEIPVLPKVLLGTPKPPEEVEEGEEGMEEGHYEGDGHDHSHGGPPSIWQQMPPRQEN